MLIPRAETARDVLPDGLESRGAEVTIMPLYRTVPVQPDESVIKAAASADASASATLDSNDTVGSDSSPFGPEATRTARSARGVVTSTSLLKQRM